MSAERAGRARSSSQPLNHRRAAADHPGMDREHEPAGRGRLAAAWFHLLGALILLVAALLGLGAYWVLTFGTSYCRDAPPTSDLVVVKLGAVAIGAALVAIAVLTGRYARRSGRAAVPWFAVAGVIAAATLAGLPAAEPAQFCF